MKSLTIGKYTLTQVSPYAVKLFFEDEELGESLTCGRYGLTREDRRDMIEDFVYMLKADKLIKVSDEDRIKQQIKLTFGIG